MAAEIFVTILTGFGLGYLLQYGRELRAMDKVIGSMLDLPGLAIANLAFVPPMSPTSRMALILEGW